ncbi:SMR family transporter [Myxococcus sp. Y35]|uniref:SMR family transporter n=1 Tax=Pseudomyxococcus flavus TaxID=3115648 RepID=UPI003CF10E3A
MNNGVYLAIAILAEVVATSALKSSNGFTRLGPSILVVLGYGVAFFCLSFALRTIPTGVAYAIWSGAGIVLVSAVAWLFQGQRLDAAALGGIGLILAGVLVINVFSKSAAH